MLSLPKEIKNLEEESISDNLLYYPYAISHLLKLRASGIDRESPQYLSSYRSFEGEAFENYMYEMLLRYIPQKDEIEYFIAKGAHHHAKIRPNTLCINSKGQIVYRTKSKEIGEFDAVFTTKTELYFVEMTLVKSVTKLKRRLRKKRALLQTIFPQYEIKSLIILNEGVIGASTFPDFCTVWVTKPFSSEWLLDKLQEGKTMKRCPFEKSNNKKVVTTQPLKVKSFRYYNTLAWIFKRSRAHKHHVLDMGFLLSKTVVQYTDLFTKIYIGYMDIADFRELTGYDKPTEQKMVIVSLDKEHTSRLILQYFIHHSRKKLDLLQPFETGLKITAKDPYGISVTEVVHISKMAEEKYRLSIGQIHSIQTILDKSNTKIS